MGRYRDRTIMYEKEVNEKKGKVKSKAKEKERE